MTTQEITEHLEHLLKYVRYSEDAPALREAIEMLKCSEIPNSSNERTDKRTGTHACDCISRQWLMECVNEGWIKFDTEKDENRFMHLVRDIAPSAQPQRTCVNCGRTANNGGWYADGRTRCPIEEHYALPKDGYCHLWEKRNVTDDDYPERREE